MIFKSDVFNLNFKNSVPYLTFKAFDKMPFLIHAFSTRAGGVSRDCYTSMNLGFSCGDERENVLKNYELFCRAVGVCEKSLVASSQDHKTFIRRVYKKDKGIGIYREKDILSVDGLITNEPGVTLATYYADCVPLFFADEKKRVIALAHAGWRGTASLIAQKMIEKFSEDFSCSPDDISVGIAPSIKQCCYEVSDDLLSEFEKSGVFDCDKIFRPKENGKLMLDLQLANKQVLLKNGIREDKIFVTDLCTSCCSDFLISHRATNGKRGVMMAIMQIKDKE